MDKVSFGGQEALVYFLLGAKTQRNSTADRGRGKGSVLRPHVRAFRGKKNRERHSQERAK
eukprot:scaffold422_cov247-Pinguiococcus_pyrenoidosus.AAC.8